MFQEITLSPQRNESAEESDMINEAQEKHIPANIDHPFKFSPVKNGDRSQSVNRALESIKSNSSHRVSPPRSKSQAKTADVVLKKMPEGTKPGTEKPLLSKRTPEKESNGHKKDLISIDSKSQIVVELPISIISKDQSIKKKFERSVSMARSARSSKRRLFTIQEDAKILDYITRNPELKRSKTAMMLAGQLDRSKEAIRDRIKRHLSNLSDNDKKKILEQAKVLFSFYSQNNPFGHLKHKGSSKKISIASVFNQQHRDAANDRGSMPPPVRQLNKEVIINFEA